MKNLTNKKFGKLTVLEKTGNRKCGCIIWKCKCDCENFVEVIGSSLTRGNTKSCGCLVSEKLSERNYKHGYSERGKVSSTYDVWSSMRKRCLNPNHPAFHNYGGRGITICERWIESFESFLEDKDERPDGMSLDRIDNDGNYTPENTRWTSFLKQSRNRRTNKLDKDKIIEIKKLIKQKELSQKEIGNIYNVSQSTISSIKNDKTWVGI